MSSARFSSAPSSALKTQSRQLLEVDGALHGVDHAADAVCGQNGLELRITAYAPQSIELSLAA
jgi:hypothetical protein